jgi:hypothetical protein
MPRQYRSVVGRSIYNGVAVVFKARLHAPPRLWLSEKMVRRGQRPKHSAASLFSTLHGDLTINAPCTHPEGLRHSNNVATAHQTKKTGTASTSLLLRCRLNQHRSRAVKALRQNHTIPVSRKAVSLSDQSLLRHPKSSVKLIVAATVPHGGSHNPAVLVTRRISIVAFGASGIWSIARRAMQRSKEASR